MNLMKTMTTTLGAAALLASTATAALAVDLQFFFPVAVGGKAADTIQALTDEYVAAHSGRDHRGGLCRQLPRHHHQDPDRGARRHPAAALGDPVGRHVHPDRGRRHHSVRRSGEERCRQGLADLVLPGVHGQLDDRRQDLRHPVPALHPGAVLEQGGLQGGRPRPEHAAEDLGRADRVRQEADQARRQRQRHPVGRADPELRLPVLAVPGADHPERRDPGQRRRQQDQLRRPEGRGGPAVPRRPVGPSTASCSRASSSGAPRRRPSSRARPR